MKKKPSTLKNMVLSLLVIAAGVALSVGFVNAVTEEPIAQARHARLVAAIETVLPEFDHLNEPDTLAVDGGNLVFFRAYYNDEFVGTAISTFTNRGFKGLIQLMAGFLPDGTIYNIDVVRHRETPGLGDRIELRFPWPHQFQGVHPNNVNLRLRQDGGEIDAITAATITARAYLEAVRLAFDNLTLEHND
ncbi:MAG: RnfABCDGE type electron transport complex subunit G [Bacteroidales bacterium]|nr:RnfABCDGE type electron transport complex subunit G [Bacteroidales bacterium]